VFLIVEGSSSNLNTTVDCVGISSGLICNWINNAKFFWVSKEFSLDESGWSTVFPSIFFTTVCWVGFFISDPVSGFNNWVNEIINVWFNTGLIDFASDILVKSKSAWWVVISVSWICLLISSVLPWKSVFVGVYKAPNFFVDVLVRNIFTFLLIKSESAWWVSPSVGWISLLVSSVLPWKSVFVGINEAPNLLIDVLV